MAKAKAKAGKKRKGPKSAPRARQAEKAPKAPAQTYPCLVHVKKGDERIPKTLGSAEEHERLVQELGAENVEVQK